MVTPAGGSGAPDGMRELIGPALTGAYALRSDQVPGGEPHAYTEGRDGEVDAAIAAAGLRLPERPLWWDVVDLLFQTGVAEAGGAGRSATLCPPSSIFWPRCASPPCRGWWAMRATARAARR